MENYLLRQALMVNEGKITPADVLIKNGRIEKIAPTANVPFRVTELDLNGSYLLPGLIDDQVHFREPGLTHKATIASESKAAIAGGITSFMEMPNTKPGAITLDLLEEKYQIASRTAAANYSFYLGAANHNLDELRRLDRSKVCGIKIFMGSSTGDLLVNDPEILDGIFKHCSETLIVTHCEDDRRIAERMAMYQKEYGENIQPHHHPEIRDHVACYLSSSLAVELAKKNQARLHVYHLSTAEELALFDPSIPLNKKRITVEACVHHLWFHSGDYERLGNLIKCNPAIKTLHDRNELQKALLDGRVDVIATDHAPHTWEEKQLPYPQAPAGLPLVQHSLLMMLEHYQHGKISLERIVQLMCHNPAILFRIKERGYIREGYKADLAVVDLQKETLVNDSRNPALPNNVLYQCGWSPLHGHRFRAAVTHTFLNGRLAWANQQLAPALQGERLEFYEHEIQ